MKDRATGANKPVWQSPAGSAIRKGTTTFPVTIGVLEILVAGVTASIWLGMLVASLAGWRGPPEWLGDGSTTLLAYAALAYALGVVVDGAADSLFTTMMKRAWPEKPSQESSRIALSAMAILSPLKDGKVKQPLQF